MPCTTTSVIRLLQSGRMPRSNAPTTFVVGASSFLMRGDNMNYTIGFSVGPASIGWSVLENDPSGSPQKIQDLACADVCRQKQNLLPLAYFTQSSVGVDTFIARVQESSLPYPKRRRLLKRNILSADKTRYYEQNIIDSQNFFPVSIVRASLWGKCRFTNY